MKSKANSNPAIRTPSASGQPSSASVPLTVYRELAAELQATRAMVDSLNSKNQELTLQNQRLRQEIQRFVKAAMNLQVLVGPTQSPVNAVPIATAQTVPPSATTPSGKPRRAKANSAIPDYSEFPTLEETAAASAVAAQLRSPEAAQSIEPEPEAPASRPARDFSGLWMTFIVIAIMVSAFGAGFLVVRPLLPTAEREETIENQLPSPEADPSLSPTENPPSP